MKVFLDMDGVIADFTEGVNRVMGIEVCPYTNPENFGIYNHYKVLGISPKVFWSHLTSEFFENLKKTVDADEIVDYLERRFGRENICILSSPPSDPTTMVGKHKWLYKHFPQYGRQFFFGTKKGFAAHKGSLLVDDADYNIKEFSEAGGQSILYPRPWNKAHGDADRAINRLIYHAENLQC